MSRKFVLCHFNDAYLIDDEAVKEPVGGAPRFSSKWNELKNKHGAENSILTCGGDIFNPSLMSIAFKGKQMVPVLNYLGVRFGCVGNHDFDFGEEILVKLLAETSCEWLLTNVTDKRNGKPVANATSTSIVDIGGIKVGFLALIEPGWMQTLTCPTDHFDYKGLSFNTYALDYIECGKRVSVELREQGAEVVVCITHMRLPEDEALCAAVSTIDLVVGGHDHFYHQSVINGVTLVKAGMDFRYLSEIIFEEQADGKFTCTHIQHDITSAVPKDPAVVVIADGFRGQLEGQLSKVIGHTETELDAMAAHLRTTETALGNFIGDMLCSEFGADVSILNSGTIRSDNIYPPGPITMKTLLQMFPFPDIMVVVKVSGKDIVEGLENGVSKYPAHEGRFPQVGGIRFSFSPSKPPGARVSNVEVVGAPVELDRIYTMVTKPYMLQGKDGYDCFFEKEYVVEPENGQLLSLMLRNYFRKLRVLNAIRHAIKPSQEKAKDKFVALLGHTEKPSLPVIAPKIDGRIRIIE